MKRKGGTLIIRRRFIHLQPNKSGLIGGWSIVDSEKKSYRNLESHWKKETLPYKHVAKPIARKIFLGRSILFILKSVVPALIINFSQMHGDIFEPVYIEKRIAFLKNR